MEVLYRKLGEKSGPIPERDREKTWGYLREMLGWGGSGGTPEKDEETT